MAHIVVLGAGLGGTIMAYEMRDALRPGDRLTVVNKGSTYCFVPSNPWVAVGWREQEEIEVDLAPVMRAQGHRVSARGRQARPPGGEPHRAERRHDARLRLSGHRHRAPNSPSTRSRASARRPTPSRSATSTTPCRRSDGVRGARRRRAARPSSARCRAPPASARPTSSPSSSRPRCAARRCATACR